MDSRHASDVNGGFHLLLRSVWTAELPFQLKGSGLASQSPSPLARSGMWDLSENGPSKETKIVIRWVKKGRRLFQTAEAASWESMEKQRGERLSGLSGTRGRGFVSWHWGSSRLAFVNRFHSDTLMKGHKSLLPEIRSVIPLLTHRNFLQAPEGMGAFV